MGGAGLGCAIQPGGCESRWCQFTTSAGVEGREWVSRGTDDELRWEVKACAGFSKSKGGRTPGWRPLPYQDRIPLCPWLPGTCSLPRSPPWDIGETFSDLAWCCDWIYRELRAGSAEVPAGRGCRPGVRACGCVHERGPGATHTHTHTLTRPHPRKALGRAARLSLRGSLAAAAERSESGASGGGRKVRRLQGSSSLAELFSMPHTSDPFPTLAWRGGGVGRAESGEGGLETTSRSQ